MNSAPTDVPEYMARVRRMARRISTPHLADEAEGAGNLALAACLSRYDPARGEFWPWAVLRIRGAMLDALRKWTGRDHRTGETPPRPLSFAEAVGFRGEEALTLADTLADRLRDLDTELDLRAALGSLQPRQREALLYWALMGETFPGAEHGTR